MPNVTLLAVVPSQEPSKRERKEHNVSNDNEEYVVFSFSYIQNPTGPRDFAAFYQAPANDGHS
jgi:hypothetical protein